MILSSNKELFKGLDGLSMILIDNNYYGKVFNMDQAIYAKDIAEDALVKITGISDKTAIIAIDKHGNESKIIRI
jgi:exoribonuclease II